MLAGTPTTMERIDAMATDAQSDHPDFGALLRRARRAVGLTQEELA